MRHFLPQQKRAAGDLFTSAVKPILLIVFFHVISLSLFAQSSVQGRVTTNDGPLPGVTVTIKGSSASTVTDAGGKFSILAADKSVLVFTHINYVPQEVVVNGTDEINVTLAPGTGNLNEVIVIGYNTQKKATLTGSVSVV